MNKASKIVMVITGLLLILASGGKIHQLLTQPLPAKPLLESWIFAIIQVPLELGLGIWLISGLFRKAGWLLAQIYGKSQLL
jgi:hypothetical protein